MPTKTMTVTFEVSDVITPAAVKMLLMDALGEFIDLRTPTDLYVQERYTPEFLSTHPLKEAQVQARIILAGRMRSSIDFPQTVAGPDIQLVEAKLQHYEQLMARVNDLHIRMLRNKQQAQDTLDALGDEVCLTEPARIQYLSLENEVEWCEAWLEALDWVRGEGKDPLAD